MSIKSDYFRESITEQELLLAALTEEDINYLRQLRLKEDNRHHWKKKS